MNDLQYEILHSAFTFLSILAVATMPTHAQELQVEAKTFVGDGWHPWYEVKVDPESSKNLIICGSKWDSSTNASLGFVYASSDGGTSWEPALEDRNSTWVVEHSCAFGPNHRAYFISEASKVVDGEPNHRLGTTRLYLSSDGGQHWIEAFKTGWADWSSSAVSSSSSRLYTFFNSRNTAEPGRNWGSDVGLLVFSPDGRNVSGPFFNSEMQRLGYHGVYPSNAIALKSGSVVALYRGMAIPPRQEADLGIIRASNALDPTLETTLISHTILGKECELLDKGALAYDPARNRLYVLYGDGCRNRRVMLSWSDDEGKTWAKGVGIVNAQNPNRTIEHPSLVVGSGGVLGLLWREGQKSVRWYFSCIRDQHLVEPPTELSSTSNDSVSNDSLFLSIFQAEENHGGTPNGVSAPSSTWNIAGKVNSVWRSIGLVAMADKFLAVWPSGDSKGMGLYAGLVSHLASSSKSVSPTDVKDSNDPDVTEESVILYGGTQSFDNSTGTLTVCLMVANRGDKPMRLPIKLKAVDLSSPIGTVSASNATNGSSGSGAIWDISDSVTGNQVPPRASSNPFCLSFHVAIAPREDLPEERRNLLILKMRVLANN